MKRQTRLFPKAVVALEQLGENIKLARRRRGITSAFDVNPNPDAAFAALDLTPGVQGASRDELVESVEYFHVDRNAAEKRYAELLSAISGWQALAQKLNIREERSRPHVAMFLQSGI